MERVYGVMVTGCDVLRKAFAEVAIKSFFEQSYPEKELVIVHSGEQMYDQEGITEVIVEQGLSLGEMRNRALKVIPENAVWTVWDDDDWKHPKLLAEQYSFIVKEGLDGCILKGMTYWSARDRFVVHAAKHHLDYKVSTIMCRNKKDITYPPLNCGEDGAFFKAYGEKYKLKMWDNEPHYHLKIVHHHNTSGIYTHIQNFILQGGWLIDKPARDYLSEVLPNYDFLTEQ